MHILYDHQVFSLQNAGGISRYYVELASRLSGLSSVDVYIGLSNGVYSFAGGPRIWNWKTTLRPGLSRYALNELLTGARALSSGHWDIYHPTLYRRMPWVRAQRTVATHHDCVQERFPELFSDRRRVMQAKRSLYAAADVIICVSNSSRDDLIAFYEVDRKKTKVIYHGVTRPARDSAKAGDFISRVKRSFLLYVGARHAYKNFVPFLRAYGSGGFAREFDLVVIGGGEFTDCERAEIRRLGLRGRVVQYASASEAVLAEAYCRAYLLVYPSLYEGFGFPPLEAMSVGCPVLAARTSSIPEVCGDAAVYFDPEKADGIENGLFAALNDYDRKARVARGLEVASRYDWQRCATETLELYHGLLGR